MPSQTYGSLAFPVIGSVPDSVGLPDPCFPDPCFTVPDPDLADISKYLEVAATLYYTQHQVRIYCLPLRSNLNHVEPFRLTFPTATDLSIIFQILVYQQNVLLVTTMSNKHSVVQDINECGEFTVNSTIQIFCFGSGLLDNFPDELHL